MVIFGVQEGLERNSLTGGGRGRDFVGLHDGIAFFCSLSRCSFLSSVCTYILIGLEARGEASRVDCLNESKKMNNFPPVWKFLNAKRRNYSVSQFVWLFSGRKIRLSFLKTNERRISCIRNDSLHTRSDPRESRSLNGIDTNSHCEHFSRARLLLE
jgi:hypothetical protein